MPLPPEFLKLKRKRGDDPPDLLYIQKETHDSKRSFTETAYHFQRIVDANGGARENGADTCTRKHISTRSDVGRVPTVRPSLPEEDIIGLHHTISHLNTQGLVPASQCFSLRVQPTPQADQTPHPTRRFLLTKDSIHYSRTVKTAVPLNHRNQYPRLEGLAIVSERKKDHLEALESHVGIQPELDRLPPQVQETRSERQRPLKHPGVYHEGRQRRQDDRKKTKHHPIAECGEDLVAIQREYDSLKLARELQLFALEQTIDDGDFKRIHERAQDIQSLIGQHKAHPQRYSHGHKLATDSGGRPAGADIVMQDDEDEYITETYVRQDGTNIANATSLKDEGSTRSSINTGLIVITDDVEDVWEDFGQDEVSDGGYTSDEEDENAEDHHANDYPDDEVDSDDGNETRFNVYRRRASDDEEYDEETVSYSDEDQSHPWKHKARH